MTTLGTMGFAVLVMLFDAFVLGFIAGKRVER